MVYSYSCSYLACSYWTRKRMVLVAAAVAFAVVVAASGLFARVVIVAKDCKMRRSYFLVLPESFYWMLFLLAAVGSPC